MNRQELLDRIAKCRQILESNPDSQIFAALAEAYRKLGDLKSALDACNDGLARHPDYGSAYLVLAKIARDQKRFDDAEKAALRAIELEGATRSAEILLSDIYIQTGKFRAAEDVLARLSKADPANQAVQRLLEIARKASQASAVAGLGSGSVRPDRAGAAAGGGKAQATQAEEAPSELTMPVSTTSGAAAGPSTSTPAESSAEPWEPLFAALANYPHLVGKLAIAFDGMLLATDIEIRSEADTAAAMAAQIWDAVHDEWPANTFGPIDQLLVETEKTTWWFWPFQEFLLVLWCEPSLNMGPLRLRIAHVDGVPALSTPGGTR